MGLPNIFDKKNDENLKELILNISNKLILVLLINENNKKEIVLN